MIGKLLNILSAPFSKMFYLCRRLTKSIEKCTNIYNIKDIYHDGFNKTNLELYMLIDCSLNLVKY